MAEDTNEGESSSDPSACYSFVVDIQRNLMLCVMFISSDCPVCLCNNCMWGWLISHKTAVAHKLNVLLDGDDTCGCEQLFSV